MMNRPETVFCALLSVATSSCAEYSRLLGYGRLPPASSFRLYDPSFSTNQVPALARSGLAVGELYYHQTNWVAPASRRPSRQLLGNCNWGPFHGPTTPDTLDHPSRLTIYTYVKFYADGRLALFSVTSSPEQMLALPKEPLDNLGYFAWHSDTARYELADRVAPAKRETGRLIVSSDSVVLIPATHSAKDKSALMPEVFHRYHRL